MRRVDTEATLLELLEQCRGLGVPSSEIDDMSALTKAGEPGVALENLCTQLFGIRFTEPCSKLAAAGPRCAHGNSIRMGRARGRMAGEREEFA